MTVTCDPRLSHVCVRESEISRVAYSSIAPYECVCVCAVFSLPLECVLREKKEGLSHRLRMPLSCSATFEGVRVREPLVLPAHVSLSQ